MIWLLASAALARAPWAQGHEMVDALGWAADSREIRRHLKDARSPTGMMAASLHPDFLRGRSRHEPLIAVELELFEDGDRRVLHAREAIVYTHHSREPTETITLRVFGNGSQTFPNSARILDLRVNGKQVAHTLQGTVLTIELPSTLRKGDRARLFLDFLVEIHPFTPSHDLKGATQVTAEVVGGLGHAADAVHLGGFLPLITPFRDGAFDSRPLPTNGEYAVFDPANIFAHIDLPAEYVVATTGVTRSVLKSGDRQTLEVVAADTRDFVVAMGRDLTVQEIDIDGTRLRVLSSAEEALMGRHLMRWATSAMEILTATYGPLSMREVDVVEAPLNIALGQEYSGLVLVDLHHKTGPYLRDDLHPWTVSHELAHQWWSMEVGSDARDAPWLDEALASHASAIVAEATSSRRAVELRFDQDIRAPLAELKRAEVGNLAANLPGDSYDIFQYSAIVYGRATLFVDAVHANLGDEAFSIAMHHYLRDNRGKTATAEDLLRAWRKQAKDPEAINALYRTMIQGTADAPPGSR